MEKMEVAMDVMNEVLGYLGTRPYQEVYTLIEKLQNEARAYGMKKQAAENLAMPDVPKIDAEPV